LSRGRSDSEDDGQPSDDPNRPALPTVSYKDGVSPKRPKTLKEKY